MEPTPFEWSPMHGWAIATAAMVSAGCAVVGTLLVVRRMSLLGDAISHAVLPGIAVAVLAGGRPGGPLVLLGAVAAALVTVGLTQVLRLGWWAGRGFEPPASCSPRCSPRASC